VDDQVAEHVVIRVRPVMNLRLVRYGTVSAAEEYDYSRNAGRRTIVMLWSVRRKRENRDSVSFPR
jgi:hypothetical protein